MNEWYDFKNFCKQSDLTLRQHFYANSVQNIEPQLNQINNPVCNNVPVTYPEPVKEVKEEELDPSQYSEVKLEDNDDRDDDDDDDSDTFSESDDKPLSEVKVIVKRKKSKDGKTKKSKDTAKPLARGRAPKAKPLCLVCNQKFSRFTELIDHQNQAHNLNFTDVNVKNENAFEELGLNKDAFAIYKCHICKEEFSGREELRNHCKTIHNTKVIQPYPCSHCDRQFPAWGLLVIHERKHTGEKPYSCDVCGKQNFISQTSLRRHKLMHLKVYSCQECGRDFNCDSALKAHIRCKHTNEKPFLCNICGRSFSLSAILVAHMTSHSSERKYICDVCGFASKTSGNHYRHKNTHKTGGAKSFHCETCGKSFDSKLKLSSHQIIHRPVRPHVCTVCGKAFLYKNKLERHILLVHARERPFPCSLCGKKLASKFGLGIHLKTHNRNEQPKLEMLEPMPIMP